MSEADEDLTNDLGDLALNVYIESILNNIITFMVFPVYVKDTLVRRTPYQDELFYGQQSHTTLHLISSRL